MKQQILAPQFGFAARRLAEDTPDSSDSPPPVTGAVAPCAWAAFGPPAGPTVVVKAARRRRLEGGAAGSGAEAAEQGGSDSPPARGAETSRTPKVFLLAPASPARADETERRSAAPVGDAAAGAGSASTASAPAAQAGKRGRGRMRDPRVAPVLIRHVVFERDDVRDAGQRDFRLDEASQGEASYETVARALHRLGDEVGALVRVHEGLAELDELTRLRTAGMARSVR